MLRPRHAALAAVLSGVAGLAAAPAHASFIVIDDFSDMLPMQVMPGGDVAPVLWVGQVGGVTRSTDLAEQTSLPGVLGGQRDVEFAIESPLHFSTLAIGAGAMFFSSGLGPSGEATLSYGNKAALNADLSLGNNPVMRFELMGDLMGHKPSLDRPVDLTITLASDSGPLRGGATASVMVTLLSNGAYDVPLSLFGGVDLTDVDMIEFHFDATEQNAIDFIVFGPVSIVPAPSAAGLAALAGLAATRRRRR